MLVKTGSLLAFRDPSPPDAVSVLFTTINTGTAPILLETHDCTFLPEIGSLPLYNQDLDDAPPSA